MSLEKHAVDAGGDGRAREKRHVASIAACRTAAAPGLLHGMRRVKDNRKSRLRHDRERAEVDDELAVTEARAPLAEEHRARPAGTHFVG